jgi:hypothetical protein
MGLISKIMNYNYWLTHDKAKAERLWNMLDFTDVDGVKRYMAGFEYKSDRPFEWNAEYLVTLDKCGEDCDGLASLWEAIFKQKLRLEGCMYYLLKKPSKWRFWTWRGHRIFVGIDLDKHEIHFCSNTTINTIQVNAISDIIIDNIVKNRFYNYDKIKRIKG